MYVVILVGPVDSVESRVYPQPVVMRLKILPNLPLALFFKRTQICG
jgi:hypothetical protein